MEKRFVKIYSDGMMNVSEIWVDRDGKPVISALPVQEEK